MAASAPTSSALESLLPRPPTPPRDTPRETNVSLKGLLRRTPSGDPSTTLHTPPNGHSPRSAGATNPSSSRLRKRVEWSNHTQYKDPPTYRQGSRLNVSSPLSAPSSASSRPVKGILKPSPSPNPLASSLSSELDGLAVQVPMIEMLESTIKQLAGSDRNSRLDAYMVLSRTLKASNNLPDRVALQNKMGLFMQFIQRDILSKNEQGNPDSVLINNALQLLITFLHFQAIASTLTSDFGVFIIDHCIRCFEDPSVPKELVRYLMQVVAFQSFSVKVMTLDRVGRLVCSLHKIEDHITGKSIVMGRIHIYKRLIKQSRGHMTVHADWLKDMFTDMLSSVRDIQTQAISLGAEAGFALRTEKHLMKKASDILQTADEQSYIEYFMERLEEMIKSKHRPSAVPQIWAVVILFLRCPLDRWQYFGPWLRIAQSAFNTADLQTKQEANYAWNRYVYLSLIDLKSMPKPLLALLTQPLISQLRRKFNAKQVDEGKKLRKIVIAGICNLCYYSLRPNHDKASTDIAWDITIQPIMAQLISLEGKPEAYGDSMRQASRILSGLFDVSTPRGWKEERVRDQLLISPEELPSLDPKWVRKNAEKIFQVVNPILKAKLADLANKESAASRLWQTLVGSVAAASAKDIKVADDTAQFISYSFGLLNEMWSTGCPGADPEHVHKFLLCVQNFIGILVSSLGLLPFTEKKLSISVNKTFEPASTPSRDQSVRAPVYHLFSMLSRIPPGGADDEVLAEFIRSVFEPFFEEKPVKHRLELAREMLRLIPKNTLSPYGPWILIAQSLRLPLEQTQALSSPNPPSSDRLLGQDYREMVAFLERGLVSHPNLPSDQWFSLFDLLSEHVVRECGDAGRALGIVEPVAKIVLDNFFSTTTTPTPTALGLTSTLFRIAKLPRDRQAVEVARRRLWGAPPTASRASSFDPFDNLYKLGSLAMIYLYENMQELNDSASMTSFIDSIVAFSTMSYPQVGVKSLLKLVDGISPWIQDDKAQLKLGDESSVSITIYGLWNSISEQLISLGHLDKGSFAQIEPLLAAGFKSKHRYIVNKTAEAWNAIVKDEEELECSDSLKSLVAALRPQVDLVLPGVEESSGEFGAQATSFIESQNDLSFVALSSAKSSRQEAVQPAPPVLSLSKIASNGPMTRKRRRDATPEVAKSKSAKRTTTPRLRHDDSQIQFAPIEPSPLAEESQHLTERQKEVRERQKDNSNLYPGIRSSPRTRSQSNLVEEPEEEPAVANNVEQLQATPERATSYEDFITSTPTPRRGQALHLMDDNEPPSSPPEPIRRYPLLTEIQTRSKSRNTMDNWEFSSPPGTPATSRQQDDHVSELPHITLTEDSTQNKADVEAKQEVIEDVDAMKVIPSSIIIGEPANVEHVAEVLGLDGDDNSSELSDVPSDPPATPPRHESSEPVEAQETPKSGEDEFVDARSSPLQPSSPLHVPPGNQEMEMVSTPNKDTSFYLSEGDESSMMRFVVELESRRCHLPIDKVNSVSPEKKQVKDPALECITVSSPSSKEKRTRERSLSPIIPSTPLGPIEEDEDQDQGASQSNSPSQSQSQPSQAESQSQGDKPAKRKRKRSAKYSETRRKKRRSVVDISIEEVAAEQVDNSQPVIPESIASEVTSLRRSPRRTHRLRSRSKQNSQSQSPPSEEEVVDPPPAAQPVADEKSKEKRDGGDTDEELMSQLINESFAALHSQPEEAAEEEELVEVEDSMDLVQATEEQQPKLTAKARRRMLRSQKKDEEEAKTTAEPSKADTIMQTLQASLDELRGAALSREEVYKLEDVILSVRKELFEAERRGRA